MNRKTLKPILLWGFLLWLFGYLLGFILFPVVPQSQLGWFITPPAILVTIWVLYKKIKLKNINNAFLTGIVWSIMAVILDYIFIVMLLKPNDGYYKPDVYLYYLLTITLPLLVYYFRKSVK